MLHGVPGGVALLDERASGLAHVVGERPEDLGAVLELHRVPETRRVEVGPHAELGHVHAVLAVGGHQLRELDRAVDQLVAREALLDSAVELAGLITANSEYGVYMTKLGMWTNLDAPSLRHAMELENRTQVLGTFTRNMTEAGSAFVEKRDPTWNPM